MNLCTLFWIWSVLFWAALFQSLLFEACGRTVNPVNGAVGLLWTGNWHVCQAAVETVLRGGELSSSSDFFAGAPVPGSDVIDLFRSSSQELNESERYNFDHDVARAHLSNLDLSLTSNLPAEIFPAGERSGGHLPRSLKRRRLGVELCVIIRV